MEIDKDKPLPGHTKLDYDECCALLILKELFPERYSDLVIADKPDLQGTKIGVEVTIAIEKDYQEVLNNWVKANSCNDENKKRKYIERMKQLGVVYSGGVQSWPGYKHSLEVVFDAVDAKVGKLQRGNYRSFEEFELFMFTDTWIWMRDDIIQELKEFFKNKKIYEYFSRIYILEKGYLLFTYKADGCDFLKIDIPEQSDRNIRARQLVELAEE